MKEIISNIVAFFCGIGIACFFIEIMSIIREYKNNHKVDCIDVEIQEWSEHYNVCMSDEAMTHLKLIIKR